MLDICRNCKEFSDYGMMTCRFDPFEFSKKTRRIAFKEASTGDELGWSRLPVPRTCPFYTEQAMAQWN